MKYMEKGENNPMTTSTEWKERYYKEFVRSLYALDSIGPETMMFFIESELLLAEQRGRDMVVDYLKEKDEEMALMFRKLLEEARTHTD